jgi:hypothetical protein
VHAAALAETTGNEWNATDELILITFDSISWNHEVRGGDK